MLNRSPLFIKFLKTLANNCVLAIGVEGSGSSGGSNGYDGAQVALQFLCNMRSILSEHAVLQNSRDSQSVVFGVTGEVARVKTVQVQGEQVHLLLERKQMTTEGGKN